jgi:hypothetical protein
MAGQVCGESGLQHHLQVLSEEASNSLQAWAVDSGVNVEAKAQETRFRPQLPVGGTGNGRKRVTRLIGARPVGQSTVQADASLA